MILIEMQDAVNAVIDDCVTQFEASNPGRLAQLVDTSETLLMAIDALFTEVPYRP